MTALWCWNWATVLVQIRSKWEVYMKRRPLSMREKEIEWSVGEGHGDSLLYTKMHYLLPQQEGPMKGPMPCLN